jgi:hypothetical protein
MTEHAKRWIEAARESQDDPAKAQVLPIVQIDDHYYFVDYRMTAIRNIDTFDIQRFDSANELIRFILKHAELIA